MLYRAKKMNHSIIYAHPHEGSLNHAILDMVVRSLEARAHQVTIRDLYKWPKQM
jgi:NAD(P)H dehydrogenase (quinone)